MNDLQSQATYAIEEIPAMDPTTISLNPIVDALLAKGDIGLWILVAAFAAHYFDLKGLISSHMENQKKLAEAVAQVAQQVKQHMEELKEKHMLDAQRHDDYISDHQTILSTVKDVDTKVTILRDDVKELRAEVKQTK